MRYAIWGGAVVLVAACSSFSGSDPGTAPPPDADGGADAGNDGRDPVTGEPADDSFVLEPVTNTVTLIQPQATAVPISLKRGKSLMGAITVKVTGLPGGVTAPPTMVDGTDGTLQLTASVSSAQGDSGAMIEASIGSTVSTTPLKIFVRGAPGALDTTWGTKGSVVVSPPNRLCRAVDLLLGPNDDFYAVVGHRTSGVNEGVVHLDSSGTIDTAYGSGWAPLFQFAAYVQAAILDSSGRVVTTGGGAGTPTLCRHRLKATTGTIDTGSCGAAGSGGDFVSNGGYAVTERDDGIIYAAFDNQNGSEVDCGIASVGNDNAFVSTFGSGGVLRNTASFPIAIFVGSGAGAALKVISLGKDVVYFVEYNSDTGTVLNGYQTPKSVPVPGVARPGVGPQGTLVLGNGNIVVPLNGSSGLYLLELDADGNSVTTFGPNGLVGPTTVGGSGVATGIAVQADGKFLVTLDSGGLIRFTATGGVDTDFGVGGIAQTTVGDRLRRKVIVQKASGRLLVSGQGASVTESVVNAYWP